MSILLQVPDKMQTILETVPEAIATDTGCVKRKRKLTGSALTQILVFGWLENPEASYQQLTETAATLGIPVSRQALEQRLTPETAEMLKQTLEAAIPEVLEITAQCHGLPLLDQFTGVFVQDSTWIPLPDELHSTWKGKPTKEYPQPAALKLHLCFDVLTGHFHHFHLTDGLTADATAAKTASPLPQGSLYLADLAYFSLGELQNLTEIGGYWVSRLKTNTALADEMGKPLALEKLLKAAGDTPFIQKKVRIGKTQQLQGYLIAEKLSQAEADKRRRSLRYRAKRKAKTPSKTLLRLADWNLYITNIEPHRLTPQQICVSIGVRWQIELMFKSFKSLSKIHVSRSQKPYRVLSELYAKLIGLLIQNLVMLGAGYRPIRQSFIKTTRYVTGAVRGITASFHRSKNALRNTLETLSVSFQKGGTFLKSIGKHTTFHRLREATQKP